ncbi:hypothetical protein ZIOFF_037436 [Zingiber officinale]|uniref:Uncharacterized protein n=1 Tax=Zingiber officinale TaxID=94328 RepID=A0A8J5KZI3_ZINOF|nr:hypothetical protein ZIOFF_037436 [Zingiber officinale]
MDTDGKADAGLLERSRRIKTAAELGLARSSRGRHWSRALLLRRRLLISKEETTTTTRAAAEVEKLGVEDEPEEKMLQARVRTLQRLVPGGEEIMEAERLFEETADYIEALQEQVGLRSHPVYGACLGTPKLRAWPVDFDELLGSDSDFDNHSSCWLEEQNQHPESASQGSQSGNPNLIVNSDYYVKMISNREASYFYIEAVDIWYSQQEPELFGGTDCLQHMFVGKKAGNSFGEGKGTLSYWKIGLLEEMAESNGGEEGVEMQDLQA